MRILTIYAKTVADLAKPKLLAGYFVPLLAIMMFMIIAMTNNQLTAGAPLFQQETDLLTSFAFLSYLISVGMPLQGLCAVFCATTIASEAERGTLRILLSKPVKRWQLYLGTFAAIVTYAMVVGLASLLITASWLFVAADLDAAALQVGVFDSLVGILAFGLFGAVVVTAVGLALAVSTKDRLRTALGALVIPVLFFMFIPVQVFSGDVYEDYHLYLVDVNYHFGHLFVFLHETVGTELPASAQSLLTVLTGVYEQPEVRGHTPQSLEFTGHVPVELSVALLAGLAVIAFTVGLVRFQRIDV